MSKSSARRHKSPSNHADTHVDGGSDLSSRHEHVGWYLHKEVSDKEDGDTCVVLGTLEVQVVLKTIESGLGDGIAIQVISVWNKYVNPGLAREDLQEVHCPKSRHDAIIQLLDQSNFGLISLRHSSRVISSFHCLENSLLPVRRMQRSILDAM